MTETTVGASALVTELDEERRRYENWLEQLEARRGSTPAHVYTRVRDDYRQRLQGVVDRLGEHAEALRGSVTELERRAEELRAEEQRVRDDRAEAELRAVVGEYSADHWEALQVQADETLEELGARRSETEEELERLRQLLALAASGPGATSSGTRDDTLRAAGEPPLVDEEVVATAPTPAGTPVTAAPEPDVPIPAAPSPTDGLGEPLDGWTRQLDDEPAPTVEPRRSPPTPEAGTGAIKTLRCQECGTMNYPTEWYCERCGGELATL